MRIFILLSLLSVVGCDANKHNRELFVDGGRIFIDKETRLEYIVKHGIGNTYNLELIPGQKQNKNKGE